MSSADISMTASVSDAIGRRGLVVVGASADGVESLTAFVGALDAGLPPRSLVVLQVPASGASALPRILERAGSYRVPIPRNSLRIL
jgi:chemotaxis response regulator CheB